MGRYPIVDIVEMHSTGSTTAALAVSVLLLGAYRVLKVHGLEMVLVGVTARETSGLVAQRLLLVILMLLGHEKWASERRVSPMRFKMSEQVVGSCKSSATLSAGVWSGHLAEMRRLVGSEVGEELEALGTLLLSSCGVGHGLRDGGGVVVLLLGRVVLGDLGHLRHRHLRDLSNLGAVVAHVLWWSRSSVSRGEYMRLCERGQKSHRRRDSGLSLGRRRRGRRRMLVLVVLV